MNKNISTQSKSLLVLAAGIAITLGLPLGVEAGSYGSYESPPVKQLKVKDHKVKVKIAGGKAKIKVKRNGKEKVKIKGPNGQIAAEMAANASAPCPSPAPAPYYGK